MTFSHGALSAVRCSYLASPGCRCGCGVTPFGRASSLRAGTSGSSSASCRFHRGAGSRPDHKMDYIRYVRPLLFPLPFFICQLLSAQGNFPFPLSNAQWAGHHDAYLTVPPWTLLSSVPNGYFMLDTDTLINGEVYAQVFDRNGEYHAALRDVGGRVMLVPEAAEDEYLLYDFTLPIGVDTMVEVWYSGTETFALNLHNLGPVGPDGRLVVQGDAGNWIEGIGSSMGLFDQVMLNLSGVNSFLDCMSHNGMILYPLSGPGICDLTTTIAERNSNSIQLYPNPATDLLHVRTTLDNGLYSIISIDGRIVQRGEFGGGLHQIPVSLLPGGIYVVVIEAFGIPIRASFIKE
jgi:hypothetical protein